MFLPISTHFTATPGIPPPSTELEPCSIGCNSQVEPRDFTTDTMALYRWAKEAGYEKQVLKAIIEKNVELRKGRGDYPDDFRI